MAQQMWLYSEKCFVQSGIKLTDSVRFVRKLFNIKNGQDFKGFWKDHMTSYCIHIRRLLIKSYIKSLFFILILFFGVKWLPVQLTRYLEFDETTEKIRVNRCSTQEELRRYRKCGLFNNERETTRAKF